MKNYTMLFDNTIGSAIKLGLSLIKDFPGSRAPVLKILSAQGTAKKRRAAYMKLGVEVPPMLIISATERCNLNCAGCYAKAHGRAHAVEATALQIETLLQQAVDAGVYMVLLAGGEPLLSKAWMNGLSGHRDLLSMIFTNGTLLDETYADFFSQNRHMLPFFSVEGDAVMTDKRRGDGVASSVYSAMDILEKHKIPFGLSITVNKNNIAYVTDTTYFEPFIAKGCRFAVFVEYVPMDESTESLILDSEDKMKLQSFCDAGNTKGRFLYIVVPGDESIYEGCLAAGRGFAHISTSGDLEPCPFAPYSDSNVFNTSLIDAFRSPLFKKIRSESHLLEEGKGGCALRDYQY